MVRGVGSDRIFQGCGVWLQKRKMDGNIVFIDLFSFLPFICFCFLRVCVVLCV